MSPLCSQVITDKVLSAENQKRAPFVQKTKLLTGQEMHPDKNILTTFVPCKVKNLEDMSKNITLKMEPQRSYFVLF